MFVRSMNQRDRFANKVELGVNASERDRDLLMVPVIISMMVKVRALLRGLASNDPWVPVMVEDSVKLTANPTVIRLLTKPLECPLVVNDRVAVSG